MRALGPTILDKFVSLGYVRTQRTGLMQMFTLSDDCTYTTKDEVIKQFQEAALEAARPAPAPAEPLANQKRLSISSFLVANKRENSLCRA